MSDKYPAIVPAPKTVKVMPGAFALGKRIVVAQPELEPLAGIVVDEIRLLTGRTVSVATGDAKGGDVWLTTDKNLKGEAYTLDVADTAVVRGGNYNAVAMGTASLLQALSEKDGVVTVPRMRVTDEPASSYRGLMVDVARKPHSIATLERCIDLCRWYKIRYLQLHLTDDEMFTFPSTAFPKLATPGKAYTLEELRGLEQYAKSRGVIIIPELDVPGHAKALVDAMPELFAVEGGRRSGWSVTMNFAKEEACRAIETIIEEMLDVFQSTPYFHIGADESNFSGFDQAPHFQEAYKKFGITGELKAPAGRASADSPGKWIKPEAHARAYELSLHFAARLNKKIKSLGRQTILWEGFSPVGVDILPKDMIVMPYHMRNYAPQWLVEDGFTLINAMAADLYVVEGWAKPALETIYEWHPHQFEWKEAAWNKVVLPPSAPVLGAQMCSWAQKEADEIPTLRKRLAVMSERLWNPDRRKGFDELAARLESTDTKLSALLTD